MGFLNLRITPNTPTRAKYTSRTTAGAGIPMIEGSDSLHTLSATKATSAAAATQNAGQRHAGVKIGSFAIVEP